MNVQKLNRSYCVSSNEMKTIDCCYLLYVSINQFQAKNRSQKNAKERWSEREKENNSFTLIRLAFDL